MAVRTPARLPDAPRMSRQNLHLCRLLDIDDLGDDLVARDDRPLAARVEAHAPRRKGETGEEAVEVGLAGFVEDDLA